MPQRAELSITNPEKMGIRGAMSRSVLSHSFQLFRFGVIGLFTVAVDFAVLYTLTSGVGVNYLFSAVAAFLIASILNYWLSVRYVFEGGRFAGHVEFGYFITTSAIGLAINQSILYVLVGHLYVNYLIAKFVSIFVVLFWNFMSKKKLVFLD
jgi:putative flippase GtrA